MQRKVALAGNRRRDRDVRRFFWPQAIAQCVEDLSLAEASGAGGIVGREVLGTGHERTNPELLCDRVSHSVQPPRRSWIVASPVTFTAGVAHDHVPAEEYLMLPCLTRLNVAAAGERRRRWLCRARGEKENRKKRAEKPR